MSRPIKNPAVYRMFDKDGALLYLGCSTDVLQRVASHRNVKAWWPEVASITVEHHADELEARMAEAIALTRESPRYNAQLRDIANCRDAQYRQKRAQRARVRRIAENRAREEAA